MSAVPGEDELAALVGTTFPGGEFTFEPWWVRLVNECGLAPVEDGAASPVFAFLAGTAAMGLSWEGLWARFDATAADGPMAGETAIEIVVPLRVGARYTVSGGIVSATRKKGARTGVFDLVEYRLELHDAAGRLAARCVNSILFPRRSP